jgi:hypothetical protein
VLNRESSGADREKRTWAAAISNATIPPVIAVFTFALINYSQSSGLYFVALTFLTTLFAAIVPLSILIIWARRTNAHDMTCLREQTGTFHCF